MPHFQDSSDAALESFRKEQRRRARMGLEQLRRVISLERSRLAPQDPYLRQGDPRDPRDPGLDTSPAVSWRFPDEIAALRRYFRSATQLLAGSSSIGPALGRLAKFGFSRKSSARLVDRMRVREEPRRGHGKTMPVQLEDYLEVALRLQTVDQTKVELLVAYYVLGYKAEDLAERLSARVDALGGRLSQARKALRRALHGLIPPRQSELGRERGRPTSQSVGSNLLDERRAKVSRLLYRRMAGTDASRGGMTNEG